MRLDTQVVVITGAAGALGQAVAQAVIERGGSAVLLVRSELPAERYAAAADRVAVCQADLRVPAAVAAAIDAALARFGRIDALVNIAGDFTYARVEDSPPDTWQAMFDINLMTAVTTSRAVLPHLPRDGSGRIVNIGALAAGKAGAGMGPYAASKAAVARLTEALAEELRPERITVNAVLPSVIDTPRNRHDMPDADFSTWVAPERIAEVIVFLLSGHSGAVTGTLLPVTGRG